MTETTNLDKGSKKDKTIKKLECALVSGEYYHAHQIYRSVCNRYFNQGNYGKAIEMLHEGSLKLLDYDQYASAADLGIYLVKAYTSSETRVDAQSVTRLMEIIKRFPPSEKTRGFLITAALDWNVKFATLNSGEPIFHDYLAELYEKEGNFIYAENHYIFGTDATSEAFAGLLYRWASVVEPSNFGYFMARGILSLIVNGNADKAIKTGKVFVSLLVEHRSDLIALNDTTSDSATVPDTKSDVVEFNIPLLNFIQLLLILLPKAGARDIYTNLRDRYQAHLVTPAYNFSEILDKIGEQFFGIRIHKPVNLLQSLMSNMFNPGGSPQGAAALPFGSLTGSTGELD